MVNEMPKQKHQVNPSSEGGGGYNKMLQASDLKVVNSFIYMTIYD